MTKEIETLGLVLQNESFNYQCYSNLIMDSWAYTDSLLTYDQCKTPKEPKMVTCSRGSSMYKPERTQSGSSPELVSLETPTNIINISSSHPQEALDLNSKLSSLCPPSVPQNSSADTYDKQAINNMFDSLLSQKWPTETAFPEATTEQALPYSDPFTKQPSPVYSDSYTNSPPERYRNDFQFVLGAPQATQHKSSQLPMVYLNKGQFYPISLQGVDSLSSNKVKTVVMAVFENDKSAEIQLRCWNHWHARQPTVKQRVIDIADYKEVFSGISHVEEVAFNALSFIWNPNEEAKVYIGINSLSTDFSSQKGVKGLPLNLQIDTYDFSTGTNRLIHRAAVQIKIFCDKGAERKMRDEDRKRSKRRGKTVIDSKTIKSVVSSSMGSDSTFLKTLEDHVTNPVLFIPEMHLSNMQRCGLAPPTTLEEVERTSLKRLYPDRVDQSSGSPPPSKQARLEEQQKVLLYVRTESEEVFDALMLNTPTLKGLRQAISEKYGMQEDSIGKIYKKCKRGIFVNMDDNIIEHYSNHSAFLIEISEVMSGQFQVTLMEL
ncbi:grainyhead-like protein 3 homolog isoform X1 [Salmo salar]|uniref:Grainyhead-like protein 3 homolog isoform X1 n=1 Tax=Salmo salar TaxID=8030 RepID=A0A1S3T1E6_SALSA|nr:grainyhead-like protein 3 homolog isoform X1 [Salmo salar]|eukprot:XP_014070415.1 PREDICTED: grainyhead-like protein 3 homolog isoform X1 [Salmo salar]